MNLLKVADNIMHMVYHNEVDHYLIDDKPFMNAEDFYTEIYARVTDVSKPVIIKIKFKQNKEFTLKISNSEFYKNTQVKLLKNVEDWGKGLEHDEKYYDPIYLTNVYNTFRWVNKMVDDNVIFKIKFASCHDKRTANIFTVFEAKLVVYGTPGFLYPTIDPKQEEPEYNNYLLGIGYNPHCLLGLGNSETKLELTRLIPKGIREIVMDSGLSFFITDDNFVYVCGNNKLYQAGLPDKNLNFVKKIDIDSIRHVYSRNKSTIFLTLDNLVFGCGDNEDGQLGFGTRDEIKSIKRIPLHKIKQVSMGDNHTLFLTHDGTIYGCGDNHCFQLTDENDDACYTLTEVPCQIGGCVKVVAGDRNSFLLFDSGIVLGCGSNFYGQLGLGDQNERLQLTQLNISKVLDIECYDNTTFFIMNDGTVKACGDNRFNQMGLGLNAKELYPNIVDLPISNVERISHNGERTFFFLKDGTVKGCGDSSQNSLGLKIFENNEYIAHSPVDVNIQKLVCVATHLDTSIFLIDDGNWVNIDGEKKPITKKHGNFNCISFGQNSKGELGIGNIWVGKGDEVFIENITEVHTSTFSDHIFFVTKDKEVYASGDNRYTQCLLDNNDEKIFKPKKIPEDLANMFFEEYVKVKCLDGITYFILKDGSCKYWGNQLLDDYTHDKKYSSGLGLTLPIDNVLDIKGNEYMHIFLTRDGKVKLFGKDISETFGLNSDKLIFELFTLPIDNVEDIGVIHYKNHNKIFILFRNGTLKMTQLMNKNTFRFTDINESNIDDLLETVPIKNVEKIKCSADHILIKTKDNKMYGFSHDSNAFGQMCKSGEFMKMNVPDSFIDFYATNGNSFFKLKDNTVLACGENRYCSLGKTTSDVVNKLESLTLLGVSEIFGTKNGTIFKSNK